MTKEQLLASLKPLQLHEEIESCLIYVTKLGRYTLIKKGYYLPSKYSVRFMDAALRHCEIGKFDSIFDACDAIKEHYNNLILNLFNLEE